jgi:hypothetical protein
MGGHVFRKRKAVDASEAAITAAVLANKQSELRAVIDRDRLRSAVLLSG